MNRSRSRHDGRRNQNQGRPDQPNQNKGDGNVKPQQGDGPKREHHQNNSGRHRRGGNDHNQRQQNNQQRRDRPQNQNPDQTPQKKFGKVIESHNLKKYGVVFYDTLQQAKNDLATLAEKAKAVDQLNIIVKAEADMRDAQLNEIGMFFAGAAWHLIHTRRVEEGWYNEPR